jgi:hypothetical protein
MEGVIREKVKVINKENCVRIGRKFVDKILPIIEDQSVGLQKMLQLKDHAGM